MPTPANNILTTAPTGSAALRKRESEEKKQERREKGEKITGHFIFDKLTAVGAATTSAFGRPARNSSDGAAGDEPPAEAGRVAGSDPAGA